MFLIELRFSARARARTRPDPTRGPGRADISRNRPRAGSGRALDKAHHVSCAASRPLAFAVSHAWRITPAVRAVLFSSLSATWSLKNQRKKIKTGELTLSKFGGKSEVWKHFKLVVGSDNICVGFVSCIKCGTLLAYDSKKKKKPVLGHLFLCSSLFTVYLFIFIFYVSSFGISDPFTIHSVISE